jgi:hypothetical protein
MTLAPTVVVAPPHGGVTPSPTTGSPHGGATPIVKKKGGGGGATNLVPIIVGIVIGVAFLVVGYLLLKRSRLAGSRYRQLSSTNGGLGNVVGNGVHDDDDGNDDDELIADIGSVTQSTVNLCTVVPNEAFDPDVDHDYESPDGHEYAHADGANEETGYMDIEPPESITMDDAETTSA